jgi:hypothetical protein
MKKLFLLSLIVVLGLSLKAQEPIFLKGDKVANLGIGLEAWRLPLSLSYEVGILDGIAEKGSIGVGGYVGGSLNWYTYNDRFSLLLGGRGAFHYPLIEKLDTYIGLSLGIDSWYAHYLRLGGFIGARYELGQKFNVFGELGSGLGYVTVGISVKL